MIADTTTAVSHFVSFLDNDGRLALSNALYDAATQHFTWMEQYHAAPCEILADGTTRQQSIDYHRAHWRDLVDAADYVSRLVIFSPV